jgi:hypothetical protein
MPSFARRHANSVLLAPLLLVASCGTVNSVRLVEDTPPCGKGFCGALLNKPTTFAVGGTGMCPSFKIDYGDSSFDVIPKSDFGGNGNQSVTVKHTYAGWSGLKTVTVAGMNDCKGNAKTKVRVENPSVTPHQGETFGYGASTSTCSITAPPFHALRKNTRVTIDSPMALATNPVPIPVIDFCAFGCSYDADGIPNSKATSPLPFPGKRQLSLVFRIGTETEQGGTHETFVTTQAGPLELCVNDHDLWDNNGAWRIFIQVDESDAP